MDTAVVFATIAGPILAVQAQKYLERLRESKREQNVVFQTLMATRFSRLSAEHVQALNSIELAFYGGWWKAKARNKRVIDALLAYNANLNIPLDDRNPFERRDALFNEMLYQMSQALGYGFSQTYIRNSCYRPSGHIDTENEFDEIRKHVLRILSGKGYLPVAGVPPSSDDATEQAELRRLLTEFLKGNVPVPVTVPRTPGDVAPL